MKTYFVCSLLLFAALICPSVRAEEEDTNLGTQVDIYKFPSIAQVEIRVGLIWVQQCVASVLTSRHVLSTATCFDGELYLRENRRIRAGSSYRGQDGEVVYILREYNHPSFGLLGADSDITVVRLDDSLPLGDTIKQVPILGQGIYLPDGLALQLVGWGTTPQGSQTSDNNLYSLDVYTYNYDRCVEKYYELEEPEIITENMICAGLSGVGGRDLDARDVGAPLFYDNVLVGVTSFGISDGNDTFPLVSTAVGSFTEWIVETGTY